MTSEVEQDNKSRSLPKSGHVQALQAEELAIRRRVVGEIMEVQKEFELAKMGFKLLSERIPCDDVEINERAMQLARFEVDGMGDLAKSGKSMAEFFDIISTRFKEHKERLVKLTDQEPSLDRFCEVCSVLKDMILASVAENDLAFFYSDTWGQGWKILKVPPKKQNPAQGIQSFYYDRAEQDRLVDALDEVFEALKFGVDTIGYPVDIEKVFLEPGWGRRLGSLTGKKRIWKIIFNGTEDKAIFTEMVLSQLSMIFDSIASVMAGMRADPLKSMRIRVSDIFNYEFQYTINKLHLCATSYRTLMSDPMQAMHESRRIVRIASLLGHRDQERRELELLNAGRIEAEAVLVNRDRHCDEEIARAEMKKEEIRGKWREIISVLREVETDFDFIFESDRKGPPVIDVELRSLLDANREYIGELPMHRPLFAPPISEGSGDAIAVIETKGVETEKDGALNAENVKLVDAGQSEESIFEKVKAAAKNGIKEAIKEAHPKHHRFIGWDEAADMFYAILGTDALNEEEKRKKRESFQRNCRNWIKKGIVPKTGTRISMDDLVSTQAWEAWLKTYLEREKFIRAKKRFLSERAGLCHQERERRKSPTA